MSIAKNLLRVAALGAAAGLVFYLTMKSSAPAADGTENAAEFLKDFCRKYFSELYAIEHLPREYIEKLMSTPSFSQFPPQLAQQLMFQGLMKEMAPKLQDLEAKVLTAMGHPDTTLQALLEGREEECAAELEVYDNLMSSFLQGNIEEPFFVPPVGLTPAVLLQAMQETQNLEFEVIEELLAEEPKLFEIIEDRGREQYKLEITDLARQRMVPKLKVAMDTLRNEKKELYPHGDVTMRSAIMHFMQHDESFQKEFENMNTEQGKFDQKMFELGAKEFRRRQAIIEEEDGEEAPALVETAQEEEEKVEEIVDEEAAAVEEVVEEVEAAVEEKVAPVEEEAVEEAPEVISA